MRISINWASSNCKLTRGSASACDEALAGKPDSGNLSLRFDEGSGLNHPLLLYLTPGDRLGMISNPDSELRNCGVPVPLLALSNLQREILRWLFLSIPEGSLNCGRAGQACLATSASRHAAHSVAEPRASSTYLAWGRAPTLAMAFGRVEQGQTDWLGPVDPRPPPIGVLALRRLPKRKL